MSDRKKIVQLSGCGPLDPISVEQLAACPFCGGEVEIAHVPTASEPIVHHPPYDRSCALADKFILASAWNRRAHQPRSGEMREAVARILEPEAFGVSLSYPSHDGVRQRALTKVDAILALISPTVTVPQDAEGECPDCHDSGYIETTSGGIWTGENISTRQDVCHCACGQDVLRERAALTRAKGGA